MASFKGLESYKEQVDKRELSNWLPVEDHLIWDEFINQFILHHYWLQIDARYTSETKTAFHNWLQTFPDREFIKRVRAKAAKDKITLNPPKKETFRPPTVCDTNTPDINKINTFIRSVAALYGCNKGLVNQIIDSKWVGLKINELLVVEYYSRQT